MQKISPFPGLFRFRAFSAAVQVHATPQGRDLPNPAEDVFLKRENLAAFTESARRLAGTDVSFSAVARRFVAYRDRSASLPFFSGFLGAGLYLYALGGTRYEPDAESLFALLREIKDPGKARTLYLDWAVTEARLIGEWVSAVYPPLWEEGALEARWVTLLSSEIERSGGNVDWRTRRDGVSVTWEGQPARLLRAVRHLPASQGHVPGRLKARFNQILKVLLMTLRAVRGARQEFVDDLARKVSKQLARIEEVQPTPILDRDLAAVAGLLRTDLLDLSELTRRGPGKPPHPELGAPFRLTVGGYLALIHKIKARLEKIDGAHDIARTIIRFAANASDPGARAIELIGRWERAYRRAVVKLRDLSGVGEIARTIANSAFKADDPVSRADILIGRWKNAFEEAKRGLRDVPDAGQIARSIANKAFSAPDSRKRARILVSRWKEAFDTAWKGFEGLEDGLRLTLSRRIAIRYFGSKDPAVDARRVVEIFWRVVRETLAQLPSIQNIETSAQKITAESFLMPERENARKEHIGNWKKAYQQALDGLGSQNVEQPEGTARQIADLMFLAGKWNRRVSEMVDAWLDVYSRARALQDEVRARAIADKRVLAEDAT